MERQNFTQRWLEGLRPKKHRFQVMDSQVRGLGVTVFPSGVRSFFHVRKILGKPERKTLGSFPDLSLDLARGEAQKRNHSVASWKAAGAEGPSPIRREQGGSTWAGMVEDYLRVKLPKASKPKLAERHMRYLAGYVPWKTRKLAAISRKDVRELHGEVAREHGAIVANRVVQFVKRIFYHAADLEIFVGANPARRLALDQEPRRTRRIMPSEMGTFLVALDKETNRNLIDFTVLALTVGARSGDIQAMKWSDIDLDAAVWMCPNEKKRRPYPVPLVSQALDVLRARPHESPVYLFPSRRRPQGHASSFLNAWSRFIKRAGLADLHPHDARRTLASWMADENYSDYIIASALGHKISGTTSIYARTADAAVRDAMQKTCDKMWRAKGKIAVLPTSERKAS